MRLRGPIWFWLMLDKGILFQVQIARSRRLTRKQRSPASIAAQISGQRIVP